MSTIKQLFSSVYVTGGRYKEYEDQVVGNKAFHKIIDLKDKGFKLSEIGKGFIVMENTRTGKTVTVYFPY